MIGWINTCSSCMWDMLLITTFTYERSLLNGIFVVARRQSFFSTISQQRSSWLRRVGLVEADYAHGQLHFSRADSM